MGIRLPARVPALINTFLSLGALVAGPAIAQGAILYVDHNISAPSCTRYAPASRSCSGGSARAYRTLYDAANAAVAGDRVYLRSGTYPGQLSPARSGTASLPITFAAYPGERPTLSGVRRPALWLVRRSHVVVDGLTVDNVSGWGRLEYANHNTIRNCTFTRATTRGTSGGLKLVRSAYNRILANRFHDGNDNITVQESDKNVIQGNTVSKGRHSLLSIRCGSYNVVRGNTFSNPAQKDIEIYDCEGTSDAPYRLNATRRNLVEQNVIANTRPSTRMYDYNGIQFAGQWGIVRRNVFRDDRGGGLNFQYYSDESLYNYKNRVYNNTFYNNDCYGIIGQSGDSSRFYDNRVQNNLLYGNTSCSGRGGGQIRIANPSQVILTSNAVLAASPGFMNAAARDLRLAPGSPMIDAAGFLTTTAGAGSGTRMRVADASYFYGGFGIPGELGDEIQLQGQISVARVLAVDLAANLLLLDRSLSWGAGTGVAHRFGGARPDMGAYESAVTATPSLTVARTGTGTGIVTSSPAGISCGTDCSQGYSYGAVVTLSRTPATGSAFVGWGGACSGTGLCRVAMTAVRSVTAAFNPIPYPLTVAKAGAGRGWVASTPPGISCGTDCAQSYSSGTLVTLTPGASTGSTFAGWSGACTGTGPCRVTMAGARSATATFRPIPYPLTVAKTGSGIVTSTPSGIACGTLCSQRYNYGTVVTLSKTAATGWTFAGWSGACTGTGACRVTMAAARSVTATFRPIPYPLTVAKTGSGMVTSSPAGIACGTLCSQRYNYGTVVSLSRTASTGWAFAGWSGACTGTGACRVTMAAARSVTATFRPIPYALTVAKTGTGRGTVSSTPAGVTCGTDCSQSYNYGTLVTLSRAAATGSTFAGWGGACSGSGSCQVTMSVARSVTANFRLISGTYTLVGTTEGDGGGTLGSSPAGVSCGANCSEHHAGTLVTLSQAPAAGSVFTGWSGACSGTGPCRVRMDAAQSVKASFRRNMYELTLTRAGDGTGRLTSSPPGIDCGGDCAELYNRGTVVSLTAVAAPGSRFTGWSGSCSGTGACRIAIDTTRKAVATFSSRAGATAVPGDFDGDGKPDLLWRNQKTGNLKVWLLDGGSMTAEANITPAGLADASWRVGGVADVDGDGHTDILWQHRQTRRLRVWLMNRTSLGSWVDAAPATLGSGDWQIRGLADFNGDGKADVLWHDPRRGALSVSLIDGTTTVSGTSVVPSRNADTGWQVEGLADFDGDELADILWRHQATGDLRVWFMKGTKQGGVSGLVPARVADRRWRIVRTADLDQNGHTDILWHNLETGDLLVWYMKGVTTTSHAPLHPSRFREPEWTMVPSTGR